MSVNEKMTAIADAIRDKTGGTEPLGLDDMAASVGDVYEAGKQNILAEHFKTSVMGSGQRIMSIAVPFKPDVFSIQSRNPYLNAANNTIIFLEGDLRTCGKWFGGLLYNNVAPSATFSNIAVSGALKYVKYENGALVIDFNNATMQNHTWPPNARYEFVAARYPSMTPKQLTEEQISMLPDAAVGTKTMEFNKARIDETFTPEEWAVLIATKPNWTFSLT